MVQRGNEIQSLHLIIIMKKGPNYIKQARGQPCFALMEKDCSALYEEHRRNPFSKNTLCWLAFNDSGVFEILPSNVRRSLNSIRLTFYPSNVRPICKLCKCLLHYLSTIFLLLIFFTF